EGGSVVFDGQDLLKVPAYRIVGLGIARTFQNVALFHDMTVLENVMLGGHSRFSSRQEKEDRKAALTALEYLRLGDLAQRPAGGHPFGALHRIQFPRPLASQPRLLLLAQPP